MYEAYVGWVVFDGLRFDLFKPKTVMEESLTAGIAALVTACGTVHTMTAEQQMHVWMDDEPDWCVAYCTGLEATEASQPELIGGYDPEVALYDRKSQMLLTWNRACMPMAGRIEKVIVKE